MIIDRHLEKELKKRYKMARSLYVFGPRQTGKTTLVKHCFSKLPYYTLEDPDVLEFVMSDPRGFLDEIDTGAIIDEPQRYPDLFSYLQRAIDIDKKKFVLTSSQNFLTMASIGQSLAGRLSILTLLSLSYQEKTKQKHSSFLKILQSSKDGQKTSRSLLPTILEGGYPEVVTKPKMASFWFSDYVQTYLEKDVRQLINVKDLSFFNRFLKLCASRSGSNLNRASLASDAGISESNCERWLTVLEQSGIVFLLPPFYKQFDKRLTKAPKVYFNDTGLLCELLDIKTVSQLENHPLRGAIIETFVVSEIRKNYFSKGQKAQLYFWRDHRGEEVDLILEEAGELYPIEIKSSQTIKDDLLSPIKKWCDLTSTKNGFVFYGGTKFQKRGDISFIPISNL